MRQRHSSPACTGSFPEQMAWGLAPINASPSSAGRVTRGVERRRDSVRQVVGSVVVIESPAARRHPDSRRPLPPAAQRRQQASNTSHTNAALKAPGAPDRSSDDTLDCSALADFFSRDGRPVSHAAIAWCYPNVGLMTTSSAHRVDASAPASVDLRAGAAADDDTLKCDGLDEFFAPLVELPVQETLTVDTPVPATPPAPSRLAPEPAGLVDRLSLIAAFANGFRKLARG